MRRALPIFAMVWSTLALAQVNAGVSDERVSLPQAGGSISGVGENASTSGNQGALSYSVNVEVPAGFPGVTPQLALSYSSLGGASVLGMGWAMPSYSIDRMTSKGLQQYGLTDRFVVDGAEELVKVAESASSATYRARFEGGFVRYTWLSRGTGAGGSWKAEFPDGRVGYYGADKAGLAVPSAQVRMPATAETFTWHLVLMEDPWGHQMKFTWNKDAATGFPLLERIEYLFEGALPRHSVRFTYEARPDVLSDAKPGFELRLDQRLKDVRVFSGTTTPEQIRKYVLDYELAATSGGATRLASVSRFGRGDVLHPVKFSFAYSQTLGGACTTNCDKPFVVSMGSFGVDFSTGRAALLDINGDAIPDVLFSDAQNRHQFFYGKLDAEGRSSFATTPVISARPTSGYQLGNPLTQLIDVNGDGFTDITQAKVPEVLCNDGSGDWVDSSLCAPVAAPVVPGAYTPDDEVGDPVQQDPRFVRFFDYDNDKRIDWLRTLSGGAGTQVLANRADGITVAPGVEDIGAVFDSDPLQLADMNGDGLQDPVQLQVSGAVVTVTYKLNLGFGHWSPAWKSVVLSGLTASQAQVAELQDINGDGLADVVAVAGNVVALVLNRNGDSFAPVLTVTSADLGGGGIIPTRITGTAGSTISFADMNGNGSDDVVWFQPGGAVHYLELFPVRPNLISRIDNGIGAVQLISYGTSIAEQARDAAAGKPWPNRVPNATVLVTRVDSFVTLTGSDTGGLRERITYRYHSGYYDGVEKQFRGYEGVEQELLSDLATDAQEPGVTVLDFDVGRLDPAFAGRERRRSVYSLATATPVLLSEERNLHELCPAADAPLSFVCDRATTTVLVERDEANARTVQVQREYDGFGNVTREAQLGVTNLGTPEAPRGCEACVASGLFGKPCGAQCTGDEFYSQTTWIAPGTATGGLWLLGKPSVVVSGAVSSALELETDTFYDGPDFVGLPAGQLTRGGVTRIARRSGTGTTDFIDAARLKLDAHGNVVDTLDAEGTPGGGAHHRRITWEAAGRWPTVVEAQPDQGLLLRRELQYEPLFEELSQLSDWYVVQGGQPIGTVQQTRYRYDEHGRLSKLIAPGDSDALPTSEYRYELADPSTRVVTLRHSAATGGQDLVTATCFDGRGRPVQTRTQVSASSWQVSGFTAFDARGKQAKVYQPWRSPSGACETAAPQGVPFQRTTYDVLGRVLSEFEPDGSERRTEYGPLVQRAFDEDATDATSPGFNTPTIEQTDGLGRLISRERTFAGGAPSGTSRLEYDANGYLLTVKDPADHPHVQRFDLLGRLRKITDSNAGDLELDYDAAGNLTRRLDARGKAVRTTFDGLNRTLAQWDEADEAGTRIDWSWDLSVGCAECTNTAGRLAQVDWRGAAPGAQRSGFDARGRRVFEEKILEGHALATRYRYDGASRLTATLYPAGLTVERAYDGAARVTSMPGLVSQVDYTERSLPEALTFTNGVKTSYTYDTRLRLASLRTVTADGVPALDLGYVRGRNGDLSELTDTGTRPERARHGARFTPDAWNRITRAELERAQGETEVLTLAYDNLDNVLNVTSSLGAASPAHVGDYTYDAARPNAVTQAGALGYSYDADGAVKTRGAAGYEYDHLGRLVRATLDGVETGTWAFGADVTRVRKQEGDFTTWYLGDDFEVRDGIALAYARLGGGRVARTQSDALAATLLSDLAPAGGNQAIDIADAWLARAAALGLAQPGVTPSPVKALLASAARRLLMEDVVWLHEDHLQSVVLATNGDGAVVGERSFSLFGDERSSAGFVDAHGFTGQEREASTGLIHFRHRQLDPLVGRWTSVDPAFLQLSAGSMEQSGQATGAYVYVGNNFANENDPDGLLGRPAASPMMNRIIASGAKKKQNLLQRAISRLRGAKPAKPRPPPTMKTAAASSAPAAQSGPYQSPGTEYQFLNMGATYEAGEPRFDTSIYGKLSAPLGQYMQAPARLADLAPAGAGVSQYAASPGAAAPAAAQTNQYAASPANQYGNFPNQYGNFAPQYVSPTTTATASELPARVSPYGTWTPVSP